MTLVLAFCSFALLVPSTVQGTEPPNLSGEWKLVSSTTQGSRGEQPSNRFVADERAFNCGRECRIVQTGATLTVENAQLNEGTSATSHSMTIELDGRPRKLVESTDPTRTAETTGRWEAGKVMISTMLYGRPATQTITLEKGQLVVVNDGASSTKLVFRYTRK